MENPAGPRIELLRFAEPRQIAPDLEERLLGRVPGIGLVAKNRPRSLVGGSDSAGNEDVEGVRIAGLGASNQLDLSRPHREIGHDRLDRSVHQPLGAKPRRPPGDRRLRHLDRALQVTTAD